MLHSVLRDPRIYIFGLFGIVIAAVVLFAPQQTVGAAKVKAKSIAVSSDGLTQVAPESGITQMMGNAGTGVNVGIDASDLIAEPKNLFAVSRLSVIGSVIGADGRVRKNPTTSYPYRANAFLEVTFAPGNSGTCTGWFVGPRTIITAGHCVYDKDTNDWANSIKVYPGRNGGTSPYGSASACRIWSVNGWVQSENTNYDYGAIILPANKAFGNTVGWYGYFSTSNGASLDEDSVRIYGYPGDKPYGQQFGMQNKIKQVSSRKLFHNVDTAGGQSGSAVYETRSNGPYVNSIHTSGVYGTSPYNRSTRIVQDVFDNIKNWKNNPTCP